MSVVYKNRAAHDWGGAHILCFCLLRHGSLILDVHMFLLLPLSIRICDDHFIMLIPGWLMLFCQQFQRFERHVAIESPL